MAPTKSNNSYLLEVDGNQCFVIGIGGTAIPINSWVWVDYQSRNMNSKVELQLTQGAHKVRFIGNQANVRLDRLVAVSDLACVPTGTGDNCNLPSDATAPVVNLTAPSEGASVSSTVNVAATATDNVAVQKVEFYVNGALQTTDTTAPYGFSWNTATTPNGAQSLTVKAYDAANNVSSDARRVTVQNEDKQAPTAPTGLTATAKAYNNITLAWQASTDDKAVTGYTIMRNNLPIKTVGAVMSYQDTSVLPATTYNYQLIAFDAAGNKSTGSNTVSVTTPTVADAQAPTAPQSLNAVAAGPRQVNLNWTASTDNIGVSAYEIYRKAWNGAYTKVADVPLASFGDATVSASTKYTYYVVAKDAAGNKSTNSTEVVATTPGYATDARTGVIEGQILSSKSGRPTVAYVTLVVDGVTRTYTSSNTGRYLIADLPKGMYNVTFSKPTYSSQTHTIKVDGTTITRNATLQLK
jgi:chitodextrinase